MLHEIEFCIEIKMRISLQLVKIDQWHIHSFNIFHFIYGSIAMTKKSTVKGKSPDKDLDLILSQSVNEIISDRKERELFFPQLVFGEPAWDILLSLFQSELNNQPMSVENACLAAGVSASTALRYLAHLSSIGLIEHKECPAGGNVACIELSAEVSHAMQNYLQATSARRR